jgi:hypothetical protein
MGMISVCDTQTPLKDFGGKGNVFFEMKNKFMKVYINDLTGSVDPLVANVPAISYSAMFHKDSGGKE